MSSAIDNLINNALTFRYSLPNKDIGIDAVKFSSCNDDAYLCESGAALSELIYNSIVDYSFDSFKIGQQDYNDLLQVALLTKIKYNELADDVEKLKYGFYGEVILYSILKCFYSANPAISRGYFYNPLENSETKGYDSYHLIEGEEGIELWFGEVKFRESLSSCVKSVVESFSKALSDNYLEKNILAMVNQVNNFSVNGSKLEYVVKSWLSDPKIKIIDEIKKHQMKLVYPVLVLYKKTDGSFDDKVKDAVDYINTECLEFSLNMSIDVDLFFIFVPLEDVSTVKKDVIEWINIKKPLMF